jgi:hypothetical protein
LVDNSFFLVDLSVLFWLMFAIVAVVRRTASHEAYQDSPVLLNRFDIISMLGHTRHATFAGETRSLWTNISRANLAIVSLSNLYSTNWSQLSNRESR